MLVYAEFTREHKPSLFGRLITWWEDCPFSHARIRFMDRDGNEKLFHAIERGVTVDPFNFGEEILVASFPVMLHCAQDEFYGVVYGMQGKAYSMGQVLTIGLRLRLKWMRNNGAKFVCSELVGQVLRDFSEVEVMGEQDDWTPKAIYRALLDHFLRTGKTFHRYPKIKP